MATAGEMRAHLAHCIQRSGEGYASLEIAKENIGAAIEAFKDAFEVAAMAAEGAQHDSAAATVQLYIEAESLARAMIGQLEEAQQAAMGGNEAAQMYMGGL